MFRCAVWPLRARGSLGTAQVMCSVMPLVVSVSGFRIVTVLCSGVFGGFGEGFTTIERFRGNSVGILQTLACLFPVLHPCHTTPPEPFRYTVVSGRRV